MKRRLNLFLEARCGGGYFVASRQQGKHAITSTRAGLHRSRHTGVDFLHGDSRANNGRLLRIGDSPRLTGTIRLSGNREIMANENVVGQLAVWHADCIIAATACSGNRPP